MDRERQKRLGAIILLALLLVAVAYYFQGVSLTWVSISKAEVEGVGWEDGEHRWRDDYWIIYATTDTAMEMKLLKLNEDTMDNPNVDNTVIDDGEIKQIVPTADLEIRIYPKQPYYDVQLTFEKLLVYPRTYGSWRNKLGASYGRLDGHYIDKLEASFWYLLKPYSYTCHTPYRAELWKNGEMLDYAEDDSYGGKNTILLQDPNTGHTVKIENFGKGEFGYNPPVHDELLIFSSSLTLQTLDARAAMKYIEYDKDDRSFSNYWFGGGDLYKDHAGHWIMRWGSDGSPSHFASYNPDSWVGVYLTYDFPGNEKGPGTFWDDWSLPVAADLTQDNPDTDPYGLSLTNYLIQKCGVKGFNFVNNPTIPWCQQVKIENNRLKLMMPAGSAYSDIVVRIPTDLAESIVVVEHYPTADVSAVWGTGGSYAEIGDKLKAIVTVTNMAGFGGNLITKAYFTSTVPGAVSPPQFTEYIEAINSRTYEFLVSNTGTDEDVDFTVKFEVWNELPELCDTTVLTGKFLKTTQISTIVTVYTRHAEWKTPLSGIMVTIAWDSQSDAKYSVGGTAVFDLGTIETNVGIVAVDPSGQYEKAETSGLVKGGDNVFYLDMYPTGTEPPPDYTLWILVAVAGCSVAGAGAYVYKKRKR